MQEYQTRIGENKKAPVLSLNGLASYSFYTPKDTGTGTRNKGVCLFDLTLLNQTSLPAFVNDIVMLQSVEPNRLDKLIEFYKEQTGKQIFISFDDVARVNDETKQILFDDNYKVIYLQEHGKALFGREWNTEEKRPTRALTYISLQIQTNYHYNQGILNNCLAKPSIDYDSFYYTV